MSDQGRFKQLEDRLDQLTIRSLISEVIFAFVTAMAIREFEEGSRRKLMNELRKSIWATVEGLPGARAEWLKLHADEQAQRLLDQIEHLATHQVDPAE